MPDLVGVCHRVAAEDVILQNTGERPVQPAIGGVSPAALPEVGGNIIELPPGNGHLVAICGVNRNNALIRRVAEDVLTILIDVGLVAREYAEL